ncbi:hypothetical protein [Robertmurraya sp.]|uniref:hypothetical protein n=1 Tax=Robertmurraya sp. TaxID=2837525 RepID=UPI003704AF01
MASEHAMNLVSELIWDVGGDPDVWKLSEDALLDYITTLENRLVEFGHTESFYNIKPEQTK